MSFLIRPYWNYTWNAYLYVYMTVKFLSNNLYVKHYDTMKFTNCIYFSMSKEVFDLYSTLQGCASKENTVYLSTCRLWRVSWASSTLHLWIGWNGFRQTSTSRFNTSISFQFFLLVISTQVASDDVGYVMRRSWVCQKVDRSSTLWTRILLYIWFQPWMGQWVCHVVNMLRRSIKTRIMMFKKQKLDFIWFCFKYSVSNS